MTLHARHQNLHGECPECEEIFDRYPGFNSEVRMWFTDVRRSVFDAHVCWAGRGKVDQQIFFHRGASDAEYGHSAHNWNAAIDIWFLDPTKVGSYNGERSKYIEMFAAVPLPAELQWYGAPRSEFPELGHVQLRNWRDDAQAGRLHLVEPV